MKLLVIEDDRATNDYIADGFRREGHSVDQVMTGQDGLVQASVGSYDVVILDRMLPGLDGIAVLKTLRGAKNKTAVILLTAVDSVDDRIEGLNAGADDYLGKPFAFGELSARVAALVRRPQMSDEPTVLRARDLELDRLTRKVTRAGQVIDLLELLLRRRGRVQTRTMLLEAVWDIHFDPQTNVVETHISRLRNKIDKPFDMPLIETLRGSGYRIDAE